MVGARLLEGLGRVLERAGEASRGIVEGATKTVFRDGEEVVSSVARNPMRPLEGPVGGSNRAARRAAAKKAASEERQAQRVLQRAANDSEIRSTSRTGGRPPRARKRAVEEAVLPEPTPYAPLINKDRAARGRAIRHFTQPEPILPVPRSGESITHKAFNKVRGLFSGSEPGTAGGVGSARKTRSGPPRARRKAINKAVIEGGAPKVPKPTGVKVTPPPKDIRGFGKTGAATAQAVKRTETGTAGMFGKGLSSMRRHKVKTTMGVLAGMGVAAKVRGGGTGTSRGKSSLYGY